MRNMIGIIGLYRAILYKDLQSVEIVADHETSDQPETNAER